MIKEAIDFVRGIKKDSYVKIGDKTFNCRLDNKLIPMEEVERVVEPEFKTIKTQTLTSIIDFISENFESLDLKKMYIHIVSENEVVLESVSMGDLKQKEQYIKAAYNEPQKRLGQYLSLEDLLVMLNAGFIQNDDLANLVSIISNVTENNVRRTKDNGLSQTVTASSGVELAEEKELPRLNTLIPYRTFPEAEQPHSDFLLRAKKGHQELSYALFEADGGAWKNKAIYNIKEYLKRELEKLKIEIPILA